MANKKRQPKPGNKRSKKSSSKHIKPTERFTRDLLSVDTFTAISIALLIFGLGISFREMQANALANSQAAKLVSSANHAYKNSKSKPTALSSAVPSTIKPTENDIASYEVAPNLPRYLIIPKIGVYARVLSVGTNSQGALLTPGNVYDTAWYDGSAEPGQPGAMLIDGHISSWISEGVFYNLKSLQAGDIIKVERGDGTIFTYQVEKSQIYSSSNVDMDAAISPINSNEPGLNLISCIGDVIPGTNEFNERIIVFASQV